MFGTYSGSFGKSVNCAFLRIYAELNDFLPSNRCQGDFPFTFDNRPSVKHALESLGIPHPEVDLILANGASVDFSYLLCHGDRISVYPRFTSIDIGDLTRVRPPTLIAVRFVLDGHLGKLAAYLRMLGFDTVYQNNLADAELAHISNDEERILLTRDRGLLMRSLVSHGYCIREKHPRYQLEEVLRRFDLCEQVQPFKRCLRCNGQLEPVAKETVLERIAPRTRKYYDQFYICPDCQRIYWQGSHYHRMSRFIEAVLVSVRGESPDQASGLRKVTSGEGV